MTIMTGTARHSAQKPHTPDARNRRNDTKIHYDVLDGSYGGCTPQCKLAPHCGDGIINGPEQCDDGDQNGLDGLCSVNCKEIIFPP